MEERLRTVSLVDPHASSSSSQTVASPSNFYQKTGDIVTVDANIASKPTTQERLIYRTHSVLGEGAFGMVTKLHLLDEIHKDQIVALKTVLQDPKYKNRELEIMLSVNHSNVTMLKWYFYTVKEHHTFLNLMMEYLPENLGSFLSIQRRAKKVLPLDFIKVLSFQLFHGMGYIHSLGICHRDMKPHNILIDHESGVLKICDFGSAKILVPGQANIAYICSRHYRAPELIIGATQYTAAVDMWSAGCIVAEMVTATPVFPGSSSTDQFSVILKVLGTPNKSELIAMNPSHKVSSLPTIVPKTISKVIVALLPNENEEIVRFLEKILRYNPSERLNSYQTLLDGFFASLKTSPAAAPLKLFSFRDSEVAEYPALASIRS